MRGTLSILGLYQEDNTLFDLLELPESEHINKQTLIDSILAEFCELEVLYTDPEFMKQIIGVWSRSRVDVWTELCKTMDYEYNPIWNKDVKDTEYIKRTKDENRTYNDSASSSTSGTATNQGVAFNTNVFEDREKNITSGSMSSSDQATTRDAGYNDEDRIYVSQGNQGITTTQQMIKEQRESVMFNIYDIIKAEFKTRFCLLVY